MALPDQSGKTFLVTGANTGIGKATAKALAAAGATVVFTSRDRAKGEAARAEIGGDSHLVLLDLASFASVREAAAEVLERWDRLDVLINNAGALIGERRSTADGFELTIGANHLGPFLLTNLLLDRLLAGPAPRVVNVASIAHRGAARVNIDDTGAYNPMGRYGESKLANILFTKQLSKRVTSFAVHPGGVRSEFGKGEGTKGLPAIGVTIIRPFEISPTVGAQASLHCATEPGLEARNGGYFQKKLFGNFGPVTEVQPTAPARDEGAASALWAESSALVGLS
jgi:NAD(P)-dependent dehydrogenase (short-subunit alcohol dehydrogenase family)